MHIPTDFCSLGPYPQTFLCCLTFVAQACRQAVFGLFTLQNQTQLIIAGHECLYACAWSLLPVPEGLKLAEDLDHSTQGRLWFLFFR